jgi:hypothetical protein
MVDEEHPRVVDDEDGDGEINFLVDMGHAINSKFRVAVVWMIRSPDARRGLSAG